MAKEPKTKLEIRAFPTTLRSIDEEARTIEFVASTEAVDRFGDIIRVAGWKLDNFLKNPIFLWAHGRDGGPAIGRSIKVAIETMPPALVNTVQFADKETYAFADTIFRLYKGKFLNMVSVGFNPLEQQPRVIENDDGGPIYGGTEFLKQELLELSGCNVPANPEAAARICKAISEGTITVEEADEVFGSEIRMIKPPPEKTGEVTPIAISLKEEIPLATESIEVIETVTEPKPAEVLESAIPAERFEPFTELRIFVESAFAGLNPTLEEIKAAVYSLMRSTCPYRKEPLADRDTPWDAATEMAEAIEPAQWKRMCAVIIGEPENKTSYKLPHHLRPAKDYATCFKGVIAALGRLDQTDMPSADKAEMRSHLEKHRDEFPEEEESFIEAAVKTSVQSVVFQKQNWTHAEAVAWLKKHEFTTEKTDETENSYRFRQFPPSDCQEDSFATYTENLPEGVAFIICRKKGKACNCEEFEDGGTSKESTPVPSVPETKAESGDRITTLSDLVRHLVKKP